MSLRRTLVVTTILAAIVASIVVGQDSRAATTARFGSLPFASRPYASHRTPITTTWYCPGIPASDPSVGGSVVIVNPTDVALQGRITLLGSDQNAPITKDVTVPARNNFTFDVAATMTATMVSATVEIDGGEGMVEQRALFPAGDAVASCTTQTSASWYFADGFTVQGSTEQLIITNPYDDTASVDVFFATQSGPREPSAFQGYSIPPHSVKVIAVAQAGLVDEPIIGVKLIASRGRVIVARAEHYTDGHRLGYTLSLGAPAPSEQLFFAEGQKGAGITEQYVIFNPTKEDAMVDVTVLGVTLSPDAVVLEPIPVPAGKVVTFESSTIAGLPDGPHSMVFSTLAAPSIVVERVLTKPAGDKVATTVVMGMTPEYAVSRWYVPIGVDAATQGALVLYNVDAAQATVTVKAIGPGGAVAVPGLETLTLVGSGTLSIDLTDPSVFGRPLVVESTQRVFVERRLPRGHSLLGRSGSWALPECGPCSFSSPPSS